MKTTLKTIATVALISLSLSSFALSKVNPLSSFNTKSIIATYVESISMGTTDVNKFLFADDFEYYNSSNKDKFNKRNYIKFLENTKGNIYDCTTEYSILDECGKSCVAKVTMKFHTFTRVDHITLTKADNAWKVSKVRVTYP